jgi:flagellar motor switch protein FliG
MSDTASPDSALTLSRRRKAAMVVHMLVADGAALPLAHLPEDVQETLTAELAALRRLDRATMASVAAEFAAELDATGLTAPGGRAGALRALASHLSPALAQRLQSQANNAGETDQWPLITDMPAARLAVIMQNESIEICAIALSKLPVAKAAEVLAKTPGPLARRITYAMAQTGDVTPDVVRRIGGALAQSYGNPPLPAFEKTPVLRLGAILNSAMPDTRDDMLAGLGDTDPDFANDLRRAIFTFKDIPARVRPIDVPACLRLVDAAQLTSAMAAALSGDDELQAAAAFILANVSQRMAAQMREDADERGPQRKADAEAAMSAVTTAIRNLADAGTITLQDPDAETD